MKRITTILLCLVLFLPCAAQLTFNYDNITICEGDTYDLLNYQTNEVIVPVGWEIIGWQGVANTTVKPAASPTVYTLEYREIANQAQIYTKDLSVYMRPKPQAILYGLVKNYVCVGETITLSGDGKNYDRLLWYCEEIGETYEGKDWETVVPDNYNNLYYRFYATNNECATKSEGVYYLDVIRPDANYEIAVNIAGGIYINENVISVPYCGKSFYLSDYVSFNSLQGLPYYDYSARIIISAPRAVWESPDIYTEGALLFLNDIGEYYENTVRYEVDLYFPDCDVHRTIVSEPMSINFYTNCTPGIAPLYFDCDERSGIGTISMSTYQNVDSILSFDFINQTTPGKYIPEGTPINNEYGQHFIRYNVTFDENVPAKLTYSATMIYRRSDGQILTYSYPNFQINTCKKEKIVEYVIGTGYATQSNGTPLCSPVTYLQCWTKNDGSPTMVRQNFCKGTSTQLTLRSNTETPWTIIFDNEEKLPTPSGATYAYVDGKHTYEFTPISTDKITFSVSPDKTTVYTGTLDGVAFAFTLNLVNYSLVSAEDTIICSGQSIDLKGLENSENIAGAVTWNITNTVVTPLVDTEYLIFGLSKNACPGTYNLQRTDRVRVMVDKPLWATQKNLLVACVNDTISLNKGINTNVRQYEWRDAENNIVDKTVTVTGYDTYYANLSNACNSATAEVSVDFDKDCNTYLMANNDTLRYGTCTSPATWQPFTVSVFDNDSINTIYPSVRILYPNTNIAIPNPATQNSRISLKQDTLIVYEAYNINTSFVDSIQYEITSQGETDTAWVFFEIEKYTTPQIIELKVYNFNLTFSIEDGKAPFVYLLDDSISSNISSFSDLKKGTHKLKVVDNNGCESQTTFTVYDGIMQAVNDTVTLSRCSRVSTWQNIYILQNDSLICANPSIRVLQSSFANYTLYPDRIYAYCDFIQHSDTDVDSLQYEISCGTEKDTAWVYAFFKMENTIHIENIKATENEVSFDIYDSEDYMFSSYNVYLLSLDGLNEIQTVRNLEDDEYEKLSVIFSDLSLTDTTYYIVVNRKNCYLIDSFEIKNGQIVIPPIIECTNDVTRINDTIYINETYTKNGFNLPAQTAIGEKTDTLKLQNQSLCDSIVILKLEVLPTVFSPCQNDTTIINDTIFANQPYNKYGFSIPVQNAAKTLVDTLKLTNQANCDSLIILHLEILPLVVPPPPCTPDSIFIADSTCVGEPYFFAGQYLTQSGTYVENYGCDSVVVLNFKMLPDYYKNFHREIVEGETYPFGNQKLHSEGIYNETLLSVSGCDSVLVLYLSVLPKGKCPEIEIPLFFSPNGDGLNDVWKIKGIECYEHKVYLYDRFSKELFVWENNFPIEGWNGMYLDKPMPSTDYWYLVVLEGRDFVGHFTLLR